MSEKLDGIRAYWNGKDLYTKNGYRINAPKFFMKNFPPFPLDGELWIERETFETVQSIVLDTTPSKEWNKVTYNIFEVPEAKGDFLQRLEKGRKWFAEHSNVYVHLIEQYPCRNKAELEKFLREIVSKRGEGVIIKDPKASYRRGRCDSILKVKTYSDAEGKVVGINPGKGKNLNMMGSLTIELKNGKRFRLGNGFTKHERENPPTKGTYVTFKHYGFTKNGIPKFASFMHERNKKTLCFK